MTSEPGTNATSENAGVLDGGGLRVRGQAWRFLSDPSALAAVAVALGGGALLIAAVAHDPAFGVTSSSSPFSDEGFNAVNARNFALLGRWSTDGWNLHLVNLPFSLVLAAVFEVFGAGIIQARLAMIAMVVVTVVLLAFGLRRPFGRWPAVLAALAYGTSTLILYYGRLVYLEDLVVLGLVAGALTLVRAEHRPVVRGVLGGLAFAVAIGTKPSAAVAVVGLLGAVAVLEGPRSAPLRRWLGAAVLTIAALGAAWVLVIWLPQRDAVAIDLRIWATVTWPKDLADAIHRIEVYVQRRDDDGAIRAAAPLIALAAVGVVAALVRASRLRSDQRRLVVAAIGWFGAGMLVLLLASYRPNRYVVPLLPALAILGAAGIALVGGALATRAPRRASVAAGIVVAIVAAAPGLAAHRSWVSATASTLPASQAELADSVPSGAIVVGVDAPTLLMSAPVVTIVARAGIPGNSGDLYTSAGARWFFAGKESQPGVVTLPPGVWEARRLVACVPWFRTQICLYKVP